MTKSIRSKKNLHFRKQKIGQVHVVTVREEPSAGHWVPIPGDGRARADTANTLDPPVQ